MTWLYVENMEDWTENLLGVISNYIKVAGYKVNIQKSIDSLYTNNEQVEFEINTQLNLI